MKAQSSVALSIATGARFTRLPSPGKTPTTLVRFGAPAPNEPQADDGEVAGVLCGPVGPGGGLTGKTVSVPDPPWQDMLRMAQPIHPLSTTFLTP
jgi:hypothetical protein